MSGVSKNETFKDRTMNRTEWGRAFNIHATTLGQYLNAATTIKAGFKDLVEKFGEPQLGKNGPRKPKPAAKAKPPTRRGRSVRIIPSSDVDTTLRVIRVVIDTSTKDGDAMAQIKLLLERQGY